MSRQEQNTKFFIKKPTNNRKSYGLVKYIPVNRSKKEYIKLSKAEQQQLDSVNELFQSGTITITEAEVRIKNFIQEHHRKQGTLTTAINKTLISSYNNKAFIKFWNAKYEDKELEDKESAKYDFKRALQAVDPVGLDSDIGSIRRKLASLPISKMKRVYARLNEIRTYLGFDEKLSTNKSEVQEISYVTLTELKRLLANTKNKDVKDSLATLFATGLRLSEMLALKPSDYSKGYLNVNKQHRRDNKVKTPKRNKIGKIVVIDELRSYVEDFLAIEDKPALRNLIQNSIVEVSNRVLKRHIHAHDLRHSHAIYLLGKGASLTLIALQLRNRIEVCQKYYSGFAHTDDTLAMLKKIAGN